MTREEAIAWLCGRRSMTFSIPQDPLETWQTRTADIGLGIYRIADVEACCK